MRRWAMPVMVLLLAATGCGSSSTDSTRAPGTDAFLAALVVSEGTLSPAFSAEVESYAMTLPGAVSSFQVTPTARAAVHAVQVKVDAGAFADVANGGTVTLNAPASGGAATVTVRVIAEDGRTMKLYRIAVTRTSTDASLSALALGGGALSPAFASTVTEYTGTVPFGATSFSVTPRAASTRAILALKQDAGAWDPVASGSTTSLSLSSGQTSRVTIRVTAEDGTTTRPYTIVVSEAAPSADAGLKALAVSAGSLAPAFDASGATTTYAVILPNGTATFTVSPVVNEPHATVQVDQDGHGFGATTATLGAPAAGGPGSLVTVRVTAQSGGTRDYVISVTQAGSGVSTDATLAALTVTGGPLTPAFASNVTSYSVLLPLDTTTFALNATVNEAHAKLQVKVDAAAFEDATSGVDVQHAAPDVGFASTVTVRVTAQDGGTVTDYSVHVSRLAPAFDAHWVLGNSQACSATGDVTCADEQLLVDPNDTRTTTLVVTYANLAATAFTDMVGSTTSPYGTRYQRATPTAGAAFAANETDVVENRYVEFDVSPAAGKSAVVDTVGAFAGTGGGSNVAYKLYWSTDDFATRSELTALASTNLPPAVDPKSAKGLLVLRAQAGLGITVPAGGALKLRLYPYWKSTSAPGTGKYLMLHGVTVTGTTR